MLGLLLVLAAQSAAPDWQVMMDSAARRLSADPAPATPEPRDYRIGDDAGTETSSKDRAVTENGSRCAVVGARRCPGKTRTIFRTPFN